MHVQAVAHGMFGRLQMAFDKDAWNKHAGYKPDLQAPLERAHSVLRIAVRLPTVCAGADVHRMNQVAWK